MLKNVKTKIISTVLVFILCFSINIIPSEAKVKELAVGGEPFGLKLYCKGVMITKLEDFKSEGVNVCPAKDCGLAQSDIITNINGVLVTDNEKTEALIKNSKGKRLLINYKRNGEKKETSLTPVKNSSGEYYAGMWVRDSCAGIGTISFYDTDNNVYGALGHGICDIDTGGLMSDSAGEILKAEVNSVNKSTDKKIGSLNGIFTDKTIGSVFENTPLGIYGKTIGSINKEKFEIADINEIRHGKAYLYTTVKGSDPKKYEIEITSVCNKSEDTNRSFTLRITDKRLLDTTGGIVQGMSGSPIIQNNKIIGALTHVFLESCDEGYGVYIGNMINK